MLHALDLIANKLGKEIGQSEIGGNIRAGQLRKMVYATFGADLALHTIQALWLEALCSLQWGRGITSAEIIFMGFAFTPHDLASIGPRNYIRGNRRRINLWAAAARTLVCERQWQDSSFTLLPSYHSHAD